MFGNRGRSDASIEGKAPKWRREGRGLGPFSSGHLTIIVVTVLIVVAFPFAAFAVTGNNVFVTDATSGAHAKVNSSGQLSVTASVNGSVTATPTPPNSSYTKWLNFTSNTACNDLLTVPTGKALIVSSVVVDAVDGAQTPPDDLVFGESDGSCTGSTKFAGSVEIPAQRTVATLNLPQGFPIKTGHHLVLRSNSSNPVTGLVWVYGYLVPSSLCTVQGGNGIAGCN